MRSEEVDSSRGHILVVGDSVAFGLGVNNNETVSYYLEKEEKVAALDYQVLNLGVSGWGIGQYYLNLKKHIENLNPKMLVLIIYVTNDLDDTRKDHHYGISKPMFHYQNGRLINLNPTSSQFSCLNLHTRLKFAKHLIPLSLIESCQTKVIEREAARPTLIKLIDEIRTLGMQRNAPTLIVLSPALTAVESVVCMKTNPPELCLNYDLGFMAFYDYFQQIMKVAKVPYVDFLQRLVDYAKEGAVKSLYVNSGKDIHHFSPKGNHILAQTIAERLESDFDMNTPEPFWGYRGRLSVP
jgi:lysophospholipase L1-like esterase